MTKVFDATKFRKSITKSIQGLGVGFSDPTDWISTGNYALNYLMTGDFNKGIPLGKVTVFAGESGAGKSYIGGIMRLLLKSTDNSFSFPLWQPVTNMTKPIIKINFTIKFFFLKQY